MVDLATMTLIEIVKLDGVKDLTPTATRSFFASALKAEATGDSAKAEMQLDKAVAAEG